MRIKIKGKAFRSYIFCKKFGVECYCPSNSVVEADNQLLHLGITLSQKGQEKEGVFSTIKKNAHFAIILTNRM